MGEVASTFRALGNHLARHTSPQSPPNLQWSRNVPLTWWRTQQLQENEGPRVDKSTGGQAVKDYLRLRGLGAGRWLLPASFGSLGTGSSKTASGCGKLRPSGN